MNDCNLLNMQVNCTVCFQFLNHRSGRRQAGLIICRQVDGMIHLFFFPSAYKERHHIIFLDHKND